MEITPFDFSGKTVRILTDDKGDFWWVGSEVCGCLGLYARDAVRYLDDDEKTKVSREHLGMNPGKKMVLVNEPGLYSLILKSRKNKSIKFKRWITHDILPTIRKTGSYSIRKQLPQDYEEALEALLISVRENKKKDQKIETDKPKVEYYNGVSKAVNVHSFNEAAKLLGIGRNTLMSKLRDDKILMRNNAPYQKHLDCGRFEVKERLFEVQGLQRLTHTTYVTGKGMTWLFGVYVPASQLSLFE